VLKTEPTRSNAKDKANDGWIYLYFVKGIDKPRFLAIIVIGKIESVTLPLLGLG
jgi:hypothetical protein